MTTASHTNALYIFFCPLLKQPYSSAKCVAHYDLGSPADTDIYHVVVAQRGVARLIKEDGEDIRTDVHDQIGDVRVEIGGLRNEMHDGLPPSIAASIRSSRCNWTNMPRPTIRR